jgi:hypothetical protein
MSQLVTISNVNANTPIDVYCCDIFGDNCIFISNESTFPFSFVVPSPYDNESYVIKIIDSEGCEINNPVVITPTPTPQITLEITNTPTPTNTPTNTQTPTNTSTSNITPTITSSITPTPTPTSAAVSHIVGLRNSTTIIGACSTPNTIVNYYTYISEANTVPVIGVTVYTFYNNGILYLPLVGNDLWYKLYFGGLPYAVNVSSSGQINSFELCI